MVPFTEMPCKIKVDLALPLMFFKLFSAISLIYFSEKAAVIACVAGCARLLDLYKQRVVVAVVINFDYLLQMT